MNYYIVPGYGANANADWFEWLDQYIVAHRQGSVQRLALPEDDDLDLSAWTTYLTKTIDATQANCLIGHSLGVLRILSYLMATNGQPVSVLLVGGFNQSLPAFPELDRLLPQTLDEEQLRKRIARGVMVTAQDDPVVPWQLSFDLASTLGIDCFVRPTGGHFLGRRAPVIGEIVAGMQKWPLA
ncbi:RBBP9/YdeN family alpha/beta hydrolase [Weissella viridescens]|nr:alpha/beta hydrolase [Weissella viridescens]